MANLRVQGISAPVEGTPSPADTWCEQARAQAHLLDALLERALPAAPALERPAIRLAQALVGTVIDQLAVLDRTQATRGFPSCAKHPHTERP